MQNTYNLVNSPILGDIRNHCAHLKDNIPVIFELPDGKRYDSVQVLTDYDNGILIFKLVSND